ncbi:hypothetical protein Cgig2_029206 [Carnegiea gigantea]|uniref:PUM-HD domain-containing protein n=1 Tax=Carnegiea gigantea TaxID=171969 RepID=A0A9Q1KKQ7_9CARY|nr:hypothetical protein Cgig2_029206 [Carnegiea gigantea]
MAPSIEAQKSKKRKRIPGGKGDAVDASKLKKKPKQPIKAPSSRAPPSGKPFEKKSEIPAKNAQLSKREMRQLAKERTEARKKKRKPHYTLEQELASLWEKMRRRNIAKDERAKLVTEALQKMKGKVPEIASSHVSSRVLQTCVKYCSEGERDAVYEELRPHFLTLSCNTYAVHLVTKMLENGHVVYSLFNVLAASKTQLTSLLSLLHGNVASLLRHTVGSVVVEQAYQIGNAAQKREILMELYSTEFQLFKDLANMKETRLVDIISKLGLKKLSVLRHMTSVLQPILEKGIVDHSIIHKALVEYLSIADKLSAEDVVKQLSGSLLVRMIHTKDGSRIGLLCVKHGGAKERKKILKGMKGHIGKIAHDHYGSLVLLSILSTVDDTKLVTKVVIRELQPILKELVLNKTEKEVHHGDDKPAKCADNDSGNNEDSKDDVKLAAIEENESVEDIDLVEGGKKDPFVRRQELLIKSGLAETLIDTCIEMAEELLMSNFGKEVLYEVATGGVDGILRPSLDEKLTTLYETVAALVAQPKSDASEHILENFHSSRTLRKLVLDCSTFALVLWEKALEGKAETWTQGHSSKVISAFVESSDPKVRELTKSELQPLLDSGVLKIHEAKAVEK